jgi:diadenosine tetraphosphatase ApaH/serine/threonine PP2A family protein phosphatase
MAMVAAGSALCVRGNHDDKLLRALWGRPVRVAHGLELSLQQLEAEPDLREPAAEFLQALPSHYLLDRGALVVTHAGIKSWMQGRDSARIRRFALYGETTGEVDELGLPVRLDWARDYRGRARVAYGHTPVREARWERRTINLDTGCVFGGRLTALRYPELELVSVPAFETYAPSRRAPEAAGAPAPAAERGRLSAGSNYTRSDSSSA